MEELGVGVMIIVILVMAAIVFGIIAAINGSKDFLYTAIILITLAVVSAGRTANKFKW